MRHTLGRAAIALSLLTAAAPAEASERPRFERSFLDRVETTAQAAFDQLLRLGLRDRLDTAAEQADRREQIRLIAHDRDAGWIELEVEQGGTSVVRVHVAALTAERASLRIYLGGPSRVGLDRVQALLRSAL